MKNSIFIDVLRYGEQVGLKGTSYGDFQKWAAEKGIINLTSNAAKDALQIDSLKKLFQDCFVSFADTEKGGSTSTIPSRCVLKTEYYFRLIEYRERHERTQAANFANRNAMWAIGISLAAVILCTILTLTLIFTPNRMKPSDLTPLINSIAVQKEVRLDSLQMAQLISAIGYNQYKPKNDRKKSVHQTESQEILHHELINRYFEDE